MSCINICNCLGKVLFSKDANIKEVVANCDCRSYCYQHSDAVCWVFLILFWTKLNRNSSPSFLRSLLISSKAYSVALEIFGEPLFHTQPHMMMMLMVLILKLRMFRAEICVDGHRGHIMREM